MNKQIIALAIAILLPLAANASAILVPLAANVSDGHFVAHCDERSLYQVSFYVENGRVSEFAPARLNGKQVYCKDNAFTIGDGRSLNDYEIGKSYFQTALPKLNEMDTQQDYSVIKDADLRDMIAQAKKKADDKMREATEAIGKKVREATLVANWGVANN